MKKLVIIGFICSILAGNLFGQKQYKYESVPNDALKARIYTLENGLKVYMSVNKEEPKIQVTIATNAGSKLDPAETTGLAHYFEHLMFKGTKHFGTNNWEAEEPLLNEIERLFEVYRTIDESKEAERKAVFKQIDSILLEGGGILNWSALHSGIVNKVQAYVAPKLFGGNAKTPVSGSGVDHPERAFMLSKPSVTQVGEDILLESEVIRCLQES